MVEFYGEKLSKEEATERIFELAYNFFSDDIKKNIKSLQKGMLEFKLELEDGRQVSHWFMLDKGICREVMKSEKVDEQRNSKN